MSSTFARLATLLSLALLGILAPTIAASQPAHGQAADVVISEVMASNDSYPDGFGATPDWVELHNVSDAPVALTGWTISDGGDVWAIPPRTLASNGYLLIWASGKDLSGPELHTNFKLASGGEPVRLSRPDGSIVDEILYPTLGPDQSWGRDGAGALGYLSAPTPGTANAVGAPGAVTFGATPGAFTTSISIPLNATLAAGQTIRYTTDGTPVTATSTASAGPVTLTESTVLRVAIEGAGILGPETTGGFVAVSPSIASQTSDLPMVLVQSSGEIVRNDMTTAIVSVIDRSPDGRTRMLGAADYTGFAGLRIRGASSSGFPKKQYKLELWSDTVETSRDADLLGLGSEDDWALYAPGRMDRAMINNPFMYELGDQIGVPAPGYQFVELWLDNGDGGALSADDYQGLYMLRETITIGDNRVDLSKHTPTSAGPEGGYIIRHDWADDCCATLAQLDPFNVVSVKSPGIDDLTPAQLAWIDAWWDDMRAASASHEFGQIEQFIDLDSFIDYWLLLALTNGPDMLILSTYFMLDAGGRLQGGPLWDFDRTMGSVDSRTNALEFAEGWGTWSGGGNSYTDQLITFDFFGDLWQVPEIQARFRARWAELRTQPLSDANVASLMATLEREITESYPRELAVWNESTPGYGPRAEHGGSLAGEIDYMGTWVQTRLNWLDAELGSNAPIELTNPGTVTAAEGEAVSVQLEVDGGVAFDWAHSDLPAGLTIDEAGLLSGTVAIGDAQTLDVTVTVTNELGGATDELFTIAIAPSFAGEAALVLNEYNAVAPGASLDLGGSDVAFGQTPGNGGDWFEVVTIDDHLDLRGWRFDLYTNSPNGVSQTASLRLGQDPRLGDIRAGTIITVAESIPEDLSYGPAYGDWTLNLQANTAGDGALFANQTDFDTNHTKWRLVIRDENLQVRAPVAGETEPWDDANFGVSSGEVFHLTTDPSSAPDAVVDYLDATSSSFGSENVAAGRTQDLSALRPNVAADGDVDCDGILTVADALLIAQFGVGNRAAVGECPIAVPATQLAALKGDINNDQTTNIIDALMISQCVVGNLANGHCPVD